MGSNRNHEGYYDPTACEAVRRTNGQRKHRPHLQYRIGEVESFRKTIEGEHGAVMNRQNCTSETTLVKPQKTALIKY